MKDKEFEIICRWIAARMRRKGIQVKEEDQDFVDAVSALRLQSVADAVGLGEETLAQVAATLGYQERKVTHRGDLRVLRR